ncbi:ABC transporter ATP-binding protein [Sphingomonas oryzagri]|uniref:ATP-binding cassette domain-containing protein n=1 Tax=Sphingomonas oryzagri TaxID=3042314 RepID=A0ABT6N3K6_9SPHN|nr:ATP-binding cassette domain-containing protein [Sphingomonas oryzagri]MDH7639880.1 ATP-binding cassette domain-containing protein [Sphingomonas oryzagri]
MTKLAVEASKLVKRFEGQRAVDGIDLAVPEGAIYGVLGPNGAGKTTTLRTLLGIIEPDEGWRRVLGEDKPMRAAPRIGYLPEERGLYPSMQAKEAIAFLGALRGMSLADGRRRAMQLLEEAGLGEAATKTIRQLSKGMAQTVQLLGTIVHRPKLLVLDEPFSGLDAINQQRLEGLIRAQVAEGATVLFSTHVIAHAERLCERISVIAKGRIRFDGTVAEARGRLPSRVSLVTRHPDGPWRAALPADTLADDRRFTFALPADGIEPVLEALIASGAGIEALSIERPSLHEAFVELVGEPVPQPETEEVAP